MARVAPAHFGAHRRIGAAPEAGQVARDLYGFVAGGQQLEYQRNAPARNRRMLREAEEFLKADRDGRAGFGLVVDRGTRAGRRFEMGRRFRVEAATQRPGKQLVSAVAISSDGASDTQS